MIPQRFGVCDISHLIHTGLKSACKLLEKEDHLRFCQEQRLLGMQRAVNRRTGHIFVIDDDNFMRCDRNRRCHHRWPMRLYLSRSTIYVSSEGKPIFLRQKRFFYEGKTMFSRRYFQAKNAFFFSEFSQFSSERKKITKVFVPVDTD